MLNEMRPCKRCDSMLVDFEQLPSGRYRGVCFYCGLVGRTCNTEEEAIEAWNRRAEGDK